MQIGVSVQNKTRKKQKQKKNNNKKQKTNKKKKKNGMANSVVPDKTATYEPYHLDLHCLDRYLFQSVGLKEITEFHLFNPVLHY